jgi:hypothetical protein
MVPAPGLFGFLRAGAWITPANAQGRIFRPLTAITAGGVQMSTFLLVQSKWANCTRWTFKQLEIIFRRAFGSRLRATNLSIIDNYSPLSRFESFDLMRAGDKKDSPA